MSDEGGKIQGLSLNQKPMDILVTNIIPTSKDSNRISTHDTFHPLC
jgi:hypothetical protein